MIKLNPLKRKFAVYTINGNHSFYVTEGKSLNFLLFFISILNVHFILKSIRIMRKNESQKIHSESQQGIALTRSQKKSHSVIMCLEAYIVCCCDLLFQLLLTDSNLFSSENKQFCSFSFYFPFSNFISWF